MARAMRANLMSVCLLGGSGRVDGDLDLGLAGDIAPQRGRVVLGDRELQRDALLLGCRGRPPSMWCRRSRRWRNTPTAGLAVQA